MPIYVPSGGSGSAKSPDATAKQQLAAAVKRINSRSNQSPTLQSYGATGKQTYGEQVNASKANPLERIGSTALAQLNRVSQAELHGVQNRYEGLGGILRGAKEGFAGSKKGFAIAPDNQINLRQAINAPQILGQQGWKTSTDAQKQQASDFVKNEGGVAGGVLDTIGSSVIDPTTYLSGGISAIAKLGKASGEARAGLKVIQEGLGKETALKVAAKGTSGLAPEEYAAVHKVLAGSPQAARVGQAKYLTTMLGGDSKLIGRQSGKLEQAQGLKFAGKTILPQTAVAGAAEATGLAKVGAKISASPVGKLGRATSDLFTPLAKTIRAQGEGAGNALSANRAARAGEATIRTNDMVDQVQKLVKALPKGVNAEKLDQEVLMPALETGTHVQVAQQLRAGGKDAEADLLEHLDALRQHITDEKLSNGTIAQQQLRDRNTYVPWSSTDKFSQHLAARPEQAEDLFGYRPQQAGILNDAAVHFRRLPFDTVKEANAHITAKSGFEGKAFHDSSIRALTKEAAKTYEHTSKIRMMDDMTKEVDDLGRPLAVRGVDNVKEVATLRKTLNTDLRDLDKKIRKISTEKAKGSVRAVAHRRATKAAQATLAAARTAYDKAEARVAHFENRTIAAGADQRTAKELGTASQAPLSDSYRKIDEVRREADTGASIRKPLAAARQELRGAKQVEAKRSGAKSVQQRVGATRTSAKYEGLLLRNAKAALSKADTAMQQAARRSQSLAENVPASVDDELAAARAERKQLKDGFSAQRNELQSAEKVERPSGYLRLDLGPAGRVYVHPQMREDILSFTSKVKNKDDLHTLGRALDSANQATKNLILNFPVFIAARNSRDFASNAIQAWQKGFSDPTAFKPAANIMRALLSKSEGATRAERLAASRLSPQEQNWLKLMEEHGALGTGQISGDVRQGKAIALTRSEKIKLAANPTNSESILTRHGSAVNDVGDKFWRAAMFIDQIKKHGDPRLAAKATKEALFDYTELTNADRAIKRVVPFYSFLKKNLALQAWALGNVPQKSLYIDRLRQNTSNDQSTGNSVLPDYALRTNQQALFKIGGVPILGSIQTPQDAAEQAIQPLVDIGSMAGGNKYRTQAGAQGGLAGLLQNVGGVPGGPAEEVFQEASGNNLFTGAPLDTGSGATAKRWLTDLTPRGTQAAGITGALGNKATKADKATQVLKLLGVTTTADTAKKQTGEIYRRKRVVEDSAKRQGIPTATALKKAKAKKTTAKK